MNYTRNDIPVIIDNFNKNIKRLVKILDSIIIDNLPFDILKRRLYIVMRESPLFLLQKIGEYIYNGKDFIINNNIDGLLQKNMDSAISTDINTLANTENMNYNEIDNLINTVRTKWVNFSSDEKEYITKIFKRLLSEYSKYKLID